MQVNVQRKTAGETTNKQAGAASEPWHRRDTHQHGTSDYNRQARGAQHTVDNRQHGARQTTATHLQHRAVNGGATGLGAAKDLRELRPVRGGNSRRTR